MIESGDSAFKAPFKVNDPTKVINIIKMIVKNTESEM